MESFDAASRAETDAYLTRCRGWSSPTAVMYGLTVAANHYQYRHGAFRDARLLWQELIDLSAKASALHWQQQATNQLTYLLIAEGAFAEAVEMAAAANELSGRLGPGQHPAAHELEMETCRAIYQGGDWADIAHRWRETLDDPSFGPHDLATLTGAFYGGIAAYCFACAGDLESTATLLELVTPLIEQMGPKDANHNGAVAFAAAAVWRVRTTQLAPVYRRLALELIESGVGDYPQTSIQLALGRMAALMNRRPEATAAFTEARRAVSANGQAPLTPVIDFSEAEALVLWADATDYDHIVELIASARHRFLEFEMSPWLEDLERLASEAETTLGGRKTLPAGITDREADVLRLIARGMSDRQVGDELYVSPRTVNAHVRNMLSKTGAANRVELAMWARNAGIVTS
jgi:DNA-binding CsgD family transcriptional regulator